MSNFDADFAVADSMLAEAFGEDAVYLAGASAISLTAEAVQRDYQVEDVEGFLTTIQATDYLVDAGALKNAAGQKVEPKAGHRIRRTVAGQVHVFEVVPLGKRPVVEWADAAGNRLVIHTKYVGTV
jgi:hypothetical protein